MKPSYRRSSCNCDQLTAGVRRDFEVLIAVLANGLEEASGDAVTADACREALRVAERGLALAHKLDRILKT